MHLLTRQFLDIMSRTERMRLYLDQNVRRTPTMDSFATTGTARRSLLDPVDCGGDPHKSTETC